MIRNFILLCDAAAVGQTPAPAESSKPGRQAPPDVNRFLNPPAGPVLEENVARPLRYRPGSMVYEIRDPLPGAGVLRLTALGMADRPGLIVRAKIEGTEDIGLMAATLQR